MSNKKLKFPVKLSRPGLYGEIHQGYWKDSLELYTYPGTKDEPGDCLGKQKMYLEAGQSLDQAVDVLRGVFMQYAVHNVKMTEPEENKTVAVKQDQGKPRFDLLSPQFLEEMAEVLAQGAVQYGDRNWEKGLGWGRIFAAANRHLWAFWRKENQDPQSKKSHLIHAACNLMFLFEHQRRNLGTDDRA